MGEILYLCNVFQIQLPMNPILIYPPNAAQAIFFQETAKKNGAEIVQLSKAQAEMIDDILFGESIEEAMKTPEVSEEKIFEILHQCK
jgi:hypothetical protein